ncbi:MAG TPA: GNVR domain-containing protein, partial [Flavisolibacter sp.]|nr:GNVR domain-containing protein [Flavisolibacter sp.]
MEEQVITKRTRAESSSLNIKELFFKYVRFLPLYIICVALSLLCAYLYLRYATEFYRSAGQLLIRDEKSAPSARSELEEAMQSGSRKNIQTEIELLQSRPLMERAVEALKLNYNYYSTGKIKELNIYKTAPFRVETIQLKDSSRQFTLNLTFPNQQSFTINGSAPIPFNQQFENQFGKFRMARVNNNTIAAECKVVYNPTPMQASMLLGGLVVVPKQNTGILTIALESTSPHLSADIINALMREYGEATIEEKNASTLKSLDFIDANLRERARELDSITRLLVAYQKAENIIDPSTQASNYFARVEEAHKEEQGQRIQYNNAVQLQDYLQANTEAPVPSSLGIDDPMLNSLIGSYNKSQLERKGLLENVKNIKSSYSQAIGTLRSSSGEAVAQIKTLPTKTQELLNIQNQLTGKMELYNQMLSKRDLSAITLASTISNTKIVQDAIPNPTPVKPDRRSTRILAFFIGLLIPTIIIVVLELMNDKVNTRHDIERLTD